MCPTCFQPECPESRGGRRPEPGSHPSRVARGEAEDRGYGEVALHPEDAVELLHAGRVTVDGEERRVVFVHNEAYVTHVTARRKG